MLSGSGKTSTGSSNGYTFIVNGDYAKFAGVKANGVMLESGKDYITGSFNGGTLITITKEGLANIGKGNHAIETVFQDGSAIKVLAVEEGGSGSDFPTAIVVGSVAGALALAGVVLLISKKRKGGKRA